MPFFAPRVKGASTKNSRPRFCDDCLDELTRYARSPLSRIDAELLQLPPALGMHVGTLVLVAHTHNGIARQLVLSRRNPNHGRRVRHELLERSHESVGVDRLELLRSRSLVQLLNMGVQS